MSLHYKITDTYTNAAMTSILELGSMVFIVEFWSVITMKAERKYNNIRYVLL